MKKMLITGILGLVWAMCPPGADAAVNPDDSLFLDRAFVVSGPGTDSVHARNLRLMRRERARAFNDPELPRFLFFDRKGRAALGIGGNIRAVGMYDFDGSIDGAGFETYKIAVPASPERRQRLGFDLSHSTLFLKMVASPEKVGHLIVYLQTEFNGSDGNGYGCYLKQAWIQVRNVTVGKARTTFADAAAMAPTIEPQGPPGQTNAWNIILQYASPSWRGFSWAVAAELAAPSYTTGTDAEKIDQRVPDIPAYIQYGWGKEESNHLRLSGIFRGMSYRDLSASCNRICPGWGVQLSALSDIYGSLSSFAHITYGHGVGRYINDLQGNDFDLVPDVGNPGRLHAPAMMGLTAGLKWKFTNRLFATGAYSRASLARASEIGPSCFRYSQYVTVNAFFNLTEDFRLGIEYLHGMRKNSDGLSGKANRFEAMVQMNF